MNEIKRCKWCNLKNPVYIKYHDEEWGVPNFNEQYLFEMLILESFQAGLSWECVLNKREAFHKAFDGFEDKNPLKKKWVVSNPEPINAGKNAFAPGITETGISFSIQC